MKGKNTEVENLTDLSVGEKEPRDAETGIENARILVDNRLDYVAQSRRRDQRMHLTATLRGSARICSTASLRSLGSNWVLVDAAKSRLLCPFR